MLKIKKETLINLEDNLIYVVGGMENKDDILRSTGTFAGMTK